MTITTQQSKAIESCRPAISLVAGAGCGKTETLARRVRRLIDDGCPPEEIAVFTFTNNAAMELKERIGPLAAKCLVGTFHAVAYRLMCTNPVIIDEPSVIDLLNKIRPSSSHSARKLMHLIGEVRQGRKVNDAGIHVLSSEFESLLKITGSIDYLGLLLWLREHAKAMEIRNVIVDEAQDNETLQWDIVHEFMNIGASGFAVGDTCQSIYEWRGAKPKDFLDFGEHMHLSHSFRMPLDVCEYANKIAIHVDPQSMPMTTENQNNGLSFSSGTWSRVVQDLLDEEMYSPKDIAVLCQTNDRVRAVAYDLRAHDIPVQDLIDTEPLLLQVLRGMAYPAWSSYKKHELVAPEFLFGKPEDIPGWLAREGINTIRDAVSCIKFNSPVHNDDIEWMLFNFGELSLKDGVNEAAISYRELRGERMGVLVTTTHQAKGLEFPVVVVSFNEINLSYMNKRSLRLLYVAATRAKERCVILDAVRYGY